MPLKAFDVIGADIVNLAMVAFPKLFVLPRMVIAYDLTLQLELLAGISRTGMK